MIRMMQLGGMGFSCSQIMLKLALEVRGQENPDLVRSMGGLAYGCGTGRGTCGALTGGACLLALYAGRGDEHEEESESLMLMLHELGDWFAERVGTCYEGVNCADIVGEQGPDASRQICGGIVAETFTRCLEILTANGFDPAGV